jgi:hypothetical protein
VHVLNQDVPPFFEEHNASITTVLSGNGREFRGREDRHPYELFPRPESIERPAAGHAVLKATATLNACIEPLLDEHSRIKGRRNMNGGTPYQVFIGGLSEMKIENKKTA